MFLCLNYFRMATTYVLSAFTSTIFRNPNFFNHQNDGHYVFPCILYIYISSELFIRIPFPQGKGSLPTFWLKDGPRDHQSRQSKAQSVPANE